MNEAELKFYQQQSKKECTICNKKFYSRLPERWLQFCSKECESKYMTDIISKAFEEAKAKSTEQIQERRKTTY